MTRLTSTILCIGLSTAACQGESLNPSAGEGPPDWVTAELSNAQDWFIPFAGGNKVTPARLGYAINGNVLEGPEIDADAELIVQTGARALRTALFWRKLEVGSRGDYARLDALLDRYLEIGERYGFSYVLQMNPGSSNPLYVAAEDNDPKVACGADGSTSDRLEGLSPHTTAEFAGYADFVAHAAVHLAERQIVDRVGRSVNIAFEIGNEPNGGFYNVCRTREKDHLANAEQYKLLARAAARAVRAAAHDDPDVQRRARSAPLYLTGLAAGAWQWRVGRPHKAAEFLERILSFDFPGPAGLQNLEDVYDGLTFHPYDTFTDGPDNPTGLEVGVVDIVTAVAAIVDHPDHVARTDSRKRLALGVTEYGYQVHDVCDRAPEDGGNTVACVLRDFDRAKYLQRGLTHMLALRRVAFVTLFTWRRPDELGQGFGMVVNSTLEPTDAWRAVQHYARQLTGTNIGARIDLGDPFVFVFPFRRDAPEAMSGFVAWHARDARVDVAIPTSGEGGEYCISKLARRRGDVQRVSTSPAGTLDVSLNSLPSFIITTNDGACDAP
ncbi:MAG: hypothetical protein H6730_30740 [Deltaproteobacteria bacterium]|nr:hypothetical protein [Deltaproteobacteria bacterium]